MSTTAPQVSTSAAPTVAVVMVTHEPGEWFDEVLHSLRDQSLAPDLIRIVDTGGTGDVRARCKELLPEATVVEAVDASGFGVAVNGATDSAYTFTLICHDDVRFRVDTIEVLVREAVQGNLGIVGPKIVDWDNERQLRSIGIGADVAGHTVSYIEPGELDQQQHDADREVLAVSSACMLVRTDLFEELGGFDPVIDFYGEDLNLGWRAHLAGARVMMTPNAVVGHLGALAARRGSRDRRRLRHRHSLWTTLTVSSAGSILRVLPHLIVVAVLELVFSLLVGRAHQAADVLAAWWWVARRPATLVRRRQAVKATRVVSDGEVRMLLARRSAKLTAYLRSGGSSSPALTSDGLMGRMREQQVQRVSVAAIFAAALLLFGSRHLLSGSVPSVGDLQPFDATFDHFLTTWQGGGVGADGPTSPLLLHLAVLRWLSFGSSALATTLVVVGALPLAAFGMWRMLGPVDVLGARVAGVGAYLALPLGYNAIESGSLPAIVAVATAPWMLFALMKVSQLPPWERSPGSSGLAPVVVLGMFGGLVIPWAPWTAVSIPLVALAMVVGGLVGGRRQGSGRLLGGSLLGVVIGLVLTLPWSAALLDPQILAHGRPSAYEFADLGRLMRFETGSLGAQPIGWFVLPAAALALLIGRGIRLGWAIRCWFVAITGWSLALAAQHGWMDPAPVPEVILAPVAAALAVSVSLGAWAFVRDLGGYEFGWRQPLALLAAGGLLVASIPMLAALAGGRFGLPQRDVRELVAFTDTTQTEGGGRVLWMADGPLLPTVGWPYDGMVIAVSPNGRPTVADLSLSNPDPSLELVVDALDRAGRGDTTRLGSLLGPHGIRYIVVPLRFDPDEGENRPPDSIAYDVLVQQFDLVELDVAGAVQVWENSEWEPWRRSVEGTGVLVEHQAPDGFVGSVHAGDLYVLDGGERWELAVDGEIIESVPLGDLAADVQFHQWVATESDSAELRYGKDSTYRAVLAVVALLWVALFSLVLRSRFGRDPEWDQT